MVKVSFTKRTQTAGYKSTVWNVLKDGRVIGRIEATTAGDWRFYGESIDAPYASTVLRRSSLRALKHTVAKVLGK